MAKTQPKTVEANSFTRLWKLLPKAGDDVWKHGVGRSTSSQKREVLELLCGTLWHLELARELGNFPKIPINHKRDKMFWELWMEQRKGLSTETCDNELIVKYRFCDPWTPDDVCTLIQSMLIADAALRLAGALTIKIVREHINGKGKRSLHSVIDSDWLEPTAEFKNSTTDVQKQIVKVVAFRDSFMHGEMPDPMGRRLQNLYKFREEKLFQYGLADIAESCRGIWNHLLSLLSPST